MKLFKKLYEASVFSPIGFPGNNDQIMATLFHRAAATLYLLYALWGFTSTITGIPSVINTYGDFTQVVFAFFVFLVAVPACIGATFFPRTGRLEMHFEMAFVGLIFFVYVIAQIVTGSINGTMLILSVLVVPISRAIFIYLILIRTASKENTE